MSQRYLINPQSNSLPVPTAGLRSWLKLIDNFSLSNMMKTVGIVSLGVGGLIFLIYFWSIGFMPEIDVKALVYLLAVSALTGVIVFVVMSISLTYPGYVWVYMTRDSKPLNSHWWFSLPIAGVILGAILSVVFIIRGGYPGNY